MNLILTHWRDIFLVFVAWEVIAHLRHICKHLANLTRRVDWQTAHIETLWEQR